MSNQQVLDYLAKHIKEDDDFIVRAAKCLTAHMEYGSLFENGESFNMGTVLAGKDTDYEYTAFVVKTDAYEFLDVLLKPFIDNLVPRGNDPTFIDNQHVAEDLRYLCRMYEREKARGLDEGYAEITFMISRGASEIELQCGDSKISLDSLCWDGIYLTK